MKQTFDQIMRELQADKRKLTAMMVLVTLGLLLWGRLLLQDNVPRVATAKPHPVEVVATISEEGTLQPLPVVYVDLPEALGRDLFAPSGAASGSRNLGRPGKSGPVFDDNAARALDTAGGLRLQSVLLGHRSRAVINGRVLGPGQEIDGWTLIEIAERHVLLKAQGLVIRLRI